MILITHQRHWMAPEKAERTCVEWKPGVTIRSQAPDWFKIGEPWAVCLMNSAPTEEWDTQLDDGCHATYMVRPGFEVAVGVKTFAFLSAAAPFLNAVTASLVLNALLAPGKPPPKRDDESSPTYGFTNLQSNNRGVGTPIPVVYGEHRVSPPIINQFVRNFFDSDGDPQSEILMLFLVSEGPIQAIGDKTADGGPFSIEEGNAIDGLQIDNQPAENFNQVEAHVRLGSNDQTAIDEFAEPVLQFEVGSIFRNSTATGTITATAGVFSAGDANITKWDNAISFTAGDDADEFSAVVAFLNGLYSISSQGNITPNIAQFQTRYREVDGSGTPFGDYIVLPPENAVQVAKQGSFSVEFKHRYLDSDDYVPPVDGFYMNCPSTMLLGGSYTIDSESITQRDDVEFTWVGWVKSDGTGVSDQRYCFFDWLDSGNNEGARLTLIMGITSAQFLLEGNEWSELSGGHSSLATLRTGTAWNLVGVSFKANFDSAGNARIRFYMNGVIVSRVIANRSLILDLGQIIRMGIRSSGAAQRWIGGMDECAFYTRELSQFEVVSKWNLGANAPPGDADENGLIVGFRYDTEAGGFSPEVFGPGTDDAVTGLLMGSGTGLSTDPDITTGSDVGIVQTPQTGTNVKSKFLVEMQRINPEDSGLDDVDEATWSSVQLRAYDDFQYPSCALLAVKIRATDQLNTSQPLVTALVKGRQVPIWDGGDAQFPVAVDTYSRNPAWISADLLVNDRYGMGAFYELSDLDVNQFKNFADWCDDRIYGGGDTVPFTSVASRPAASVAGWSVDLIEWRVTSLPPNFPQPTAGVLTSSDVFLNITGTSVTPSFPSWVTSNTATSAEVLQVAWDSDTSLFHVRVPHLSTTSTITTFSATSTDYVYKIFEPRMRYDGVFDRAEFPAWDALLQVLLTARAVPVRLGSRMSIFFDDARTPVALIGMGSMIEGSFQLDYSDIASRPNAQEVTYFNRDDNYERTPISREHPDLTNPTLQSSFRWRRLVLEGVTRRSQALRHIVRDLNVFNLLRRTIQFEVGIDALLYQPGDVVAISHDVPDFGTSGRIWADTPEKNLLSEWIDWTQWDTNAFAETPTLTNVTGPLSYGAVYEISSNSDGGTSGIYSLDAGIMPPDGTTQLLSFYVKKGTATTFEMNIRDETASQSYAAVFDWSGATPSETSSHANITSTITASGNSFFLIEILLSGVTGIEDNARKVYIYAPALGSPAANKDYQVWGPMLEEGVASASATPAMQIQVDRPLTIAAATDYQIQVEDSLADTRETVRVNTIATPAGTYSASSAITLSGSGLSFLPRKDDEWAFGTVSGGESELYSIVETRLDPRKLKHRVRAVEYNASVYDDDFGQFESEAVNTVPEAGDSAVPHGVENFQITEETALSPDGSVLIGAAISFTHPPETYHAVWETRIYVAEGTATAGVGAAELVRTLPRTKTFHRITEFRFERNRTYTIYAQPVTRTGAGQYRNFVSYGEFTANGLAPTPLAPTSPSAKVAGEEVIYTWGDPGDNDLVKSLELRRGGWILGERIATLPSGTLQYGPTPDWVGAPANAAGMTAPPIYIRSKRGTGQASPVALLQFEPVPIGNEGDALETSREDGNWVGTLVGMTKFAPPLPVGVTVTNQLIASGSGTTHTYQFTGTPFSTAVPVFLQVGVEAEQHHPATLTELDKLGPIGGRNMGRWTLEGPLVALSGDAGSTVNCTLTTEVAFSTSLTAGSDFREYKAGIYRMRSFKVKVTVVRPDATYNFAITRLSVRATKIGARRADPVIASTFSPS